MISPELLNRYSFFGGLENGHLKALAMIAQEEQLAGDVTIFQEGEPAETLYFLEEGSVVLYYTGSETDIERFRDGIPVGEINPGEPFSISALIEPHLLTSTARTSKPSRVIKFEAKALQNLFKNNRRLAYLLTHQAAQAVIERLLSTRIQLAAAWA